MVEAPWREGYHLWGGGAAPVPRWSTVAGPRGGAQLPQILGVPHPPSVGWGQAAASRWIVSQAPQLSHRVYTVRFEQRRTAHLAITGPLIFWYHL